MYRLPHSLKELVNAIERAVNLLAFDLPGLSDKDVEWAYSQYVAYFKELASGGDRPEPTAIARHRDLLLEHIWEALLKREDLDLDTSLVGTTDFDPAGSPISSLDHLYLITFKWLRTSVRHTREKRNPRAYLDLLADTMLEMPVGNSGTLAHLQKKYGVNVIGTDRKGTVTKLRELRQIEDPKRFLERARDYDMPLYLNEVPPLLEGTVYRSDFLDFSLVAIRLAALTDDDEHVFRLADDLLLTDFDYATLTEVEFWFIQTIGTRFSTALEQKTTPKWAKPYAARYMSGVRLVRTWSVDYRIREIDEEIERLLIQGRVEEE